MKYISFFLLCFLVSSCCTKQECTSTDPVFTVTLKSQDTNELLVTSYFEDEITDQKKLAITNDTVLEFAINALYAKSSSLEFESVDKIDVIKDFEIDVVSNDIVDCNKCLFANGEVEIEQYEVKRFMVNGKLLEGNNYEISF